MAKSKVKRERNTAGKLRIGDHWNAINIIALSQSNPLKAVAEFVENSIDAKAKNITIFRGRENGQPFLRIVDDGNGLPTDSNGLPDFKYVATHICDSIKRGLKTNVNSGLQGEFGIGLLSFWTVGEELSMISAGKEGKTYEMRMTKGSPEYRILPKRTLFSDPGMQLTIKPLLSGIRHLSGEKIQWYLASELRDRIGNSNVNVRIIDRTARTNYEVKPKKFSGRFLHHLPAVTGRNGGIHCELYLNEQNNGNHVDLYKSGTRVIENLATLEELEKAPWISGYLQGAIDVPFLNLTPGTRRGIIMDDAYSDFLTAIEPLEIAVLEIIDNQKHAEEEEANKDTLKSIRRAFKEALFALPEEEYDWFETYGIDSSGKRTIMPTGVTVSEKHSNENLDNQPRQKAFFEHAGSLFSVRISPASCVIPVNQRKNFRAIARDRSARLVEEALHYRWKVIEGQADIENTNLEIITVHTADDPELIKLEVTVTQQQIECTALALITVTDSLIPEKPQSREKQGLPDYTFEKLPGQLWRSRYNREKNLVTINNGHRDFVYASRQKVRKLRYICRLFAKELVIHNFRGYPPEQLLERMIELELYTEENLR